MPGKRFRHFLEQFSTEEAFFLPHFVECDVILLDMLCRLQLFQAGFLICRGEEFVEYSGHQIHVSSGQHSGTNDRQFHGHVVI